MGFSVLTAREMKQELKNESGGRERKEIFLSSPPLLALLLAPFFARSLTLVPRSLFLNRAEMLATQATAKETTLTHEKQEFRRST